MRGKVFLVLALSILAGPRCPGVAAQTADHDSRTEPVAIVRGEPLYERDLPAVAQGQLRQLALRQYEQRKKILQQLIERYLVDAEAKKRGMSAETLLDEEVDKTVPDPTEGELRAYYLGLRDKTGRPFDEVRSELAKTFREARILEARQAFFNTVRERNKATVSLRPPRVEVGVDAERLLGNPRAPLTIVEFSDFQCPYCQRSEAILKQLLTRYKDAVNLSYRDFPLKDVHPQAELAAEAARCAGEQGKFWQFHDMLFENQDKLQRAALLEDARGLKLDGLRFDSCLNSGKYQGQIDRDVQDGIRAGVSATPGFFINGVFIGGAQAVQAFEEVIDGELAELAGKSPQD